jgi:hypothetical protein
LEKESSRLLAVKQKDARAILAKIVPVIAAIEALENVVEFALIALPLREPLEVKKEFLQNTQACATAIMTGLDPTDLPELPSLKAVVDAIAAAKKVIALITGVLAAIARAHR